MPESSVFYLKAWLLRWPLRDSQDGTLQSIIHDMSFYLRASPAAIGQPPLSPSVLRIHPAAPMPPSIFLLCSQRQTAQISISCHLNDQIFWQLLYSRMVGLSTKSCFFLYFRRCLQILRRSVLLFFVLVSFLTFYSYVAGFLAGISTAVFVITTVLDLILFTF